MVWSAGGSGGLTTEQLDTALATQTTAIDASIVDELDSTSRNLLRVRSMTITTANQSTTSLGWGYQRLTTTTITAQGVSPDFDFNTNFQMCALHTTLTLVNETAGSYAYCQLIVNRVIDGPYAYNFSPAATGAVNNGDTPITFIYPITGSFVGLPTSAGYEGDIFIEVWGKVEGVAGTTVISDISHKCWSYRGA